MGTAKVSGSANGTLNSNEYTVNSTHSKWCITSLEVTVMVNYTAKYTPSMLQPNCHNQCNRQWYFKEARGYSQWYGKYGTLCSQEFRVSGTANIILYRQVYIVNCKVKRSRQ